MEQKLQLCVFMLLIHVSHAVWQRVTVKKGETVDLNCPVTNAHQTSIDWKNPEGYVMFFKHNKEVFKGLQDKRYSMSKLSASEFTVSISGVTFKDGGNYTCSQYGDHITEKIVELTVLDNPKMKRTKDKGRFNIKCISEGNHYPPQISWKLDQGPEILAHSQVVHGDHKYVSRAMLHIQSVESRVTVKCLVRHPALLSQPLMDFVKIGRNPAKSHHKTTTNSSAAQGSTAVRKTTTDWFRHGRTTVFPTTRDVNGPSSESTITLSAVPSNQLLPSNEPRTDTTPTGSRVNTAHTSGTSVLSSSTSSNNTINNRTSTTGWTSVSETTEEITFYNHTEGNGTGSFNDPKMQTTGEGSSTLLVFLVTCLIFGLLVVVIFFAIKLRRAHITWKRENEDSDPSEESNKSKSSQEEKNSQGQRRRGVLNTAFTQYVVETSPAITSVINTAAMAATKGVNEAQTSQLQTSGQTSARCNIKETEL